MSASEQGGAGGGGGGGFGGRGRDRYALPRTSVQSLFDRQPPQSLEAEMSVLGSLLLDPKMIPDVMSVIRGPEDFASEAHGHIYRALVDVYDRRHAADLVLVLDALRDKGVLESVGGDGYLLQLAEAVPAATSAVHFARIVREKSKLRKLIDAAGQILYDAYHSGELGPEGAREVLDRAEMSVFEIAQEEEASDPQGLAELLEIELRRIEAFDFEGGSVSGVATGYLELDELLRGFQPGELLILAARPSMGKTALALNLAEQIAIGGPPVPGASQGAKHPVGVFSLEMSKNALVQRLLSQRSGVSSQMLRGGHKIPNEDFRRLMLAAEDLKSAPIYIDDTPGLTILNLRARARRMVAQHGVRCIMIDYLQLMSAPGAARESRQVEVSAISRGVKALARELKVPVVCLSQLNRASESREGNRPRMSDLRESGSIEQDADVIMLLHREEYYHVQEENWKEENPDKVGIAEVIIAKQRNGPTGVVKLRWNNHTTRFENYDPYAQPPAGMAMGDRGGGGGIDEGRFGGGGGGRVESSRPAASVPWTQGGGAGSGGGAELPPFDMNEPPTVVTRPVGGGSGSPGSSPGGAFGGRPRTGPIESHRDGGGPSEFDEMTEDGV